MQLAELEELLPQRCRLEPGKPHHRQQQDPGVSALQMRSRQEVGANHLQTVSRAICTCPASGLRLERLLDDRSLAQFAVTVDNCDWN